MAELYLGLISLAASENLQLGSVGDPEQLQVMGARAARCHIPAGTLSLSGDLQGAVCAGTQVL